MPIYELGDDGGGALDFGEGVGFVAVQRAEVYEPPVWPPEPGKQGMQLHLEVEVSDLSAAVEHAHRARGDAGGVPAPGRRPGAA